MAGQAEEAERLYREALAELAPILKIRKAIGDLDDFLRLFPDHTQAQAMRSLLHGRLA